MKEKELRERARCDLCLELIGTSGPPLFWTVRLVQHGVKLGAVRRQDGLANLLGGLAILAQVMGPDEEMTETMNDVEVTVCHSCAIGPAVYVYHLAQRAARGREREAVTS